MKNEKHSISRISFEKTASKHTLLKTKLPKGYFVADCQVYVSTKGELTTLQSYQHTTLEGNSSGGHYGLASVGDQVTIIGIAHLDGQIFYVVKETIIVEDHCEVMDVFRPTTRSELADLFNRLP